MTMDVETLVRFLTWCTLINGALLIFWTAVLRLAPELIYRTQRAVVDLPRESILTILYGFLAVYKIFFMMFNLVPLVALLILQ